MSMLKISRVIASLLIPTISITAMALSVSGASTPSPKPALAEAQLRVINHRFVNAFATPDIGFIDRLTANNFLLTSNSGEWLTRAQHIDAMRKTSLTGVSYDDLRVRQYGAIALLHGVFEAITDNNVPVRVRYTDVYQWNDGRWQLISAQNTPMREGVSKSTQMGTATQYAKWSGSDPSGNEEEVLRTLNENYVRAYRESDVSWYDAHLSADYVVIGGDGSLSDRAKALNDFAKPSFATHMRTFPVDKVTIRRFGDIALIHAENAYERKDGKKGVSRYIDIWHRQENGRWLCIAAHITTYKAPI